MSCGSRGRDYTKRISVTTNDPSHPKETLLGKARIIDPLTVVPKNAHFGELSYNESVSKRIVIKRGGGGPVTPTLKPVKVQGLEVRVLELEPGEHYEVEVTARPPFTSDKISAILEVESGIVGAPVTKIPVSARIIPRVVAQPKSFWIPRRRESTWEQNVHLVWNDKTPHRILGVSVSDPGLQVRVAEEHGAQHVTLQVAPAFRPRRGGYVVNIETDDPEAPVVTVPVAVEEKTKSSGGKRITRPSRHPHKKNRGGTRPGVTKGTEAGGT